MSKTAIECDSCQRTADCIIIDGVMLCGECAGQEDEAMWHGIMLLFIFLGVLAIREDVREIRKILQRNRTDDIEKG